MTGGRTKVGARNRKTERQRERRRGRKTDIRKQRQTDRETESIEQTERHADTFHRMLPNGPSSIGPATTHCMMNRSYRQFVNIDRQRQTDGRKDRDRQTTRQRERQREREGDRYAQRQTYKETETNRRTTGGERNGKTVEEAERKRECIPLGYYH